MVKRVVAMLIGALAGTALWYAVAWLRSPVEAEADPISIENCARDAYVDCVSEDDAFHVAPEAPSEPVAQPCKDFLNEDAGVAALSACLHEVRRGEDAGRVKTLQRAQLLAGSS